MLMIGDPGTGKSMLARSMTDLLPQDALEDVLVYPNEDDENEPVFARYQQVGLSVLYVFRKRPFENKKKRRNVCS